MILESILPEISDVIFNPFLEHIFGWGFLEQIKGVGEVVFMAEVTDMGKPVPFALTGVSKETVGNNIEDVARKATDHAKESKLLDV